MLMDQEKKQAIDNKFKVGTEIKAKEALKAIEERKAHQQHWAMKTQEKRDE
jgi:hypothetical protein